MVEKVYVGSRAGGPDKRDAVVTVLEDGNPRALPLRLDLKSHSPGGFEWAYGNDGPAQLALAMLADFTESDRYALRHYHWFKLEVVSSLPSDGWKLTEREIRAWINEHHPLDD